MLVYLPTLLPAPSVDDWAEMQWIPARLGIPHPTGYPLYVLLGKAFRPDPDRLARTPGRAAVRGVRGRFGRSSPVRRSLRSSCRS